MDIKKLNILTSTGPNWRSYIIQIQAAARILDCWDVIKWEALGTNPQTWDLLPFPTSTTQIVEAELATAKIAWNKKNFQALGSTQGTMSPALW